jgi:cytochrome c oxidase subunit 3
METTAVGADTKWWNGGKSPFNVEYGKLMMWYFLMSDAFTFGAFLLLMVQFVFQAMDGLTQMKFLNLIPASEKLNAPLVFVSIMTFILDC